MLDFVVKFAQDESLVRQLFNMGADSNGELLKTAGGQRYTYPVRHDIWHELSAIVD